MSWFYFRAIDGKGYWNLPRLGMVFIQRDTREEALKTFAEKCGFVPEIWTVPTPGNYHLFGPFDTLDLASLSARSGAAGDVPLIDFLEHPFVAIYPKESACVETCY